MEKLWMPGFNLRAHLRASRLKVTIVAVMALFMLVPFLTAVAQEDDDFMLEEITVTGSRIRGGETVGATVVGIDREAMSVSSGVTIDRIIKELPQIVNLGVTESSERGTGSPGNRTYSNGINIHGIGPYATLILLDGHRVTDAGREIDPSIVPSLGLERIEIVSDGASAVYGSDAIAGVVNLIPRRSLNGVETSLRYGMGDNFNEHQVGFAAGNEWKSGQVMFALEHAYRSDLSGDDRSFFTSDQRSFGGPDYRHRRSSPGTIITGGGRSGLPETTYAIPEGGVAQETAGTLIPGTFNLMHLEPGVDLLPEQEYLTMNSTFNQTITSRLEFFADGFYSKRDYTFDSAGVWQDLTVPSTNAFFVQPPGQTVKSYVIGYNFIDDLGGPQNSGSIENWQVTPGIRLDLPHGFQLEALYTYGKTDNHAETINGLDSRGSLVQALASSDPATAFDPYGLGRTSEATLAAISDDSIESILFNKFNGYEMRLNGPLFDTPGGTVRVAAGYEGQEVDLDLGDRRGVPGSLMVWRNYRRRVDSTYVELLVPVVGSANARAGIRKLEFTGAVRYDYYEDIDQSTTNPKFGFNYSPIDSLSFHGSYGTSFRAPKIHEIYGNTFATRRYLFQDPDGGAPLEGYVYTDSNLDIEPETADTWSLGGDFKPTENTGIKLSYFSVDYENKIVKNSNNLTILSMESAYAGTGVILRGAEAGDKVAELTAQGVEPQSPFPGGDPNNVTLYIDGRNRNLGISITHGFDFEVSHLLNKASAGSFLFNLGGTYLTLFEEAVTAAGEKVDRLNDIFNPKRLHARGSVTWNYRPFMSRVAFRYVNSYDNTAVVPTESVDRYMPVDISVRFNGDNVDWLGSFGRGLSVGLEARNVFDTDPPYVNIVPGKDGGGYDPTSSDPVGRLISLSLRKNF